MAIFEFNEDNNWKYKGILSAHADLKEIEDMMGMPAGLRGLKEKNYQVEILGIIWTDENDDWHMKMRLKFPSGNKQVMGNSYGKEANETKVLTDMYRFPMKNKEWIRNEDGKLESLIELLKKNDMIDSIEVMDAVI